jgi:hypothetical protein
MKKHFIALKAKLSVHLPTVFKPALVEPTSVGEIIADFEKKVTQLTNVHSAKLHAIDKNKRTIAQIELDNASYQTEASRAEAVANKLRALLA